MVNSKQRYEFPGYTFLIKVNMTRKCNLGLFWSIFFNFMEDFGSIGNITS